MSSNNKSEKNKVRKKKIVKDMLKNQNKINPGAFGCSNVNRKLKYLKEHK
jgi:hypothetical protein